MANVAYFITHPNVAMSKDVPVTRWPLSELGRARMTNCLKQRAPGKPEATRVKVPPVELDGSRPKEMPGMRPRGRSRKRGIF
ncbi:MAG: hypothetical protein WAM53_10790, partial [Terrimicrobiaceae bacterium]